MYFSEMYIYNDEIYFYDTYDGTEIYKMPLNGGDMQKILIPESCEYIQDFEIANGYIYITGYERTVDVLNGKEINCYYYRLKTDGTGLTKQKEPFEWRY